MAVNVDLLCWTGSTFRREVGGEGPGFFFALTFFPLSTSTLVFLLYGLLVYTLTISESLDYSDSTTLHPGAESAHQLSNSTDLLSHPSEDNYNTVLGIYQTSPKLVQCESPPVQLQSPFPCACTTPPYSPYHFYWHSSEAYQLPDTPNRTRRNAVP